MDRFKSFIKVITGEFLWAAILIPILAISWVGFYTIARDIGIPPLFAAGLSAAFDGIALFAARIGIKYRRKGFSGYLARFTVIAFAALGAFVQSFHGETQAWIHAHSWIVWATAPVAACLAYELHLGWEHRKQLIRNGYVHPSAKSGFGPASWLFIGGTWSSYRNVLRARRDYIAQTNLARFAQEEAVQPKLARPKSEAVAQSPVPPSSPPALHSVPSRTAPSRTAPSRTAPSRHAAKPARSRSQARSGSSQDPVRAWALENGFTLGYRNRIPIEALNAYRSAHPQRRGA